MLKFNTKELNLIYRAVSRLDESASKEDISVIISTLKKLFETGKIDPEEKRLNENIQILDKVKIGKERGYVTGQIDGKMIVQVQGSTHLVDPKDIKEFNKKPEMTTKPHMKFDEETQKVLFEQFVKCGIYHGNVPIKLSDCYVKYSSWNNAQPDQQIKVLVEGTVSFMPRSQVKILENLNDFANEENYIPGAIIDETTDEVIENILLHVDDYTSAIGDADSVRIIRKNEAGEQEMQTVPKGIVRTLSV
jgi:dsDNA-specific endonuclease/ATPase MutS2